MPFKRVHDDVVMLAELGLVEGSKAGACYAHLAHAEWPAFPRGVGLAPMKTPRW
jgi:hypothetical protein